ncbi:MAG: 2,3-diaminopropionate biosynthesis protein SbnB [Pyrinomonadaceae bacterium]
MRDGDLLILKGDEVGGLLAGRELEIMQAVEKAYVSHAQQRSSLPHSTFLRFPDNQRNRIIALPAYLDGDFDIAGLKWVSSFPGNLDKGLDRASAVVILNSAETGRPEAILEGSIISAKRTAASAALAAQHLRVNQKDDSATLIGCGLINYEVARFLLTACPEIKRLVVFDLDTKRAGLFREKCLKTLAVDEVEVVSEIKKALTSTTLISMATTAAKPHVFDLKGCSPSTTILHVSLRDFSPEVMLSCDNVVDDVDHVCRAETSIHLAEQLVGNRDFVRCTLADILQQHSPKRLDDGRIAMFSPFGLGVLDLAVSKLVRDLGLTQGLGMTVNSFLPS